MKNSDKKLRILVAAQSALALEVNRAGGFEASSLQNHVDVSLLFTA